MARTVRTKMRADENAETARFVRRTVELEEQLADARAEIARLRAERAHLRQEQRATFNALLNAAGDVEEGAPFTIRCVCGAHATVNAVGEDGNAIGIGVFEYESFIRAYLCPNRDKITRIATAHDADVLPEHHVIIRDAKGRLGVHNG